MDDVTLVIAAPGDPVHAVQQTLSVWARAGLVRPFLWWHGRCAEGHLVRFNCRQDAEPMLEAIGCHEYSTVRLVALTIVDSASDGVRPEGVQALAAEIEEVLTARLGVAQRLVRVNLIVPVSGIRSLSQALLNSYWDVNLVAADEDRRTPRQISPEIRHPGRLVSHAAAVLATVAGVWPGLGAGPFDGLREGGGQEARVRAVRSYVRLLRCHDLVEGVSRQILDLQENWQWLADAVKATQVEEPAAVLAVVTDQFFAGPGARLTRTPALPPLPAPPRRLTPIAAFLELWRFLLAAGRRAPADIAGYVKDRALARFETFAQDVVFGEDSTAKVKIGSRTYLAERDNGERISDGGAEFASSLLGSLGSQAPVPALGEQWRALRSLSFGLVDAGELPEGVDAPEYRTRRLVVSDIYRIAPDPFEVPFEYGTAPDGNQQPGNTPAARRRIAPCDPAAAARAGAELVEGTPDRERFDAWLGGRRGSLLWHIGERIAADGAAAESTLVGALESIARPRAATSVDRRETSRMYLALILIALLATAVGAFGVGLWIRDLVTARTMVQICAAAAVGWLGLSLAVFYPYVSKQFRLANALLRRFNEDKAARVVAEHEAAELLRLAAAYREYQDWAVIIGSVLHRPGGELTRSGAVELDDLALPDAVGIGVAETDPRQRRRLAAIVGRQHYHRGWASGLLTEFTSASMADLKFEKGAEANDPDPQPDIDQQARHRLLRDLMRGAAGSFGRRVRDDVGRNADRLPIEELFSGLREPVGQTPESFLTAILSQPLAPVRESFSWQMWHPGRGPAEDETHVWLPTSVSPAVHARNIHPIPGGGGTGLILVLRFDVSGPGRGADLKLFDSPEMVSPDTVKPSLDGVG